MVIDCIYIAAPNFEVPKWDPILGTALLLNGGTFVRLKKGCGQQRGFVDSALPGIRLVQGLGFGTTSSVFMSSTGREGRMCTAKQSLLVASHL